MKEDNKHLDKGCRNETIFWRPAVPNSDWPNDDADASAAGLAQHDALAGLVCV